MGQVFREAFEEPARGPWSEGHERETVHGVRQCAFVKFGLHGGGCPSMFEVLLDFLFLVKLLEEWNVGAIFGFKEEFLDVCGRVAQRSTVVEVLGGPEPQIPRDSVVKHEPKCAEKTGFARPFEPKNGKVRVNFLDVSLTTECLGRKHALDQDLVFVNVSVSQPI